MAQLSITNFVHITWQTENLEVKGGNVSELFAELFFPCVLEKCGPDKDFYKTVFVVGVTQPLR